MMLITCIGIILQSLRPNPQSRRGRFKSARAVDIKPHFAQAHRILGIVLSSLGQLDAAEASLRRALSIEPESADILYDLAMVLSVTRQVRGSIAADSAHARACADVDDQSGFCQPA